MIYRKASWLLLIVVVLAVAIIFSGCKETTVNTPEPSWIEVSTDSEKMSSLQKECDNGHRVGLLDPTQVTYEFLEQELAIPGNTVNDMQEEKQRNGHIYVTVRLQDGRTIQLVLVQPVRTGPTGIWCVQKYRFLNK